MDRRICRLSPFGRSCPGLSGFFLSLRLCACALILSAEGAIIRRRLRFERGSQSG